MSRTHKACTLQGGRGASGQQEDLGTRTQAQKERTRLSDRRDSSSGRGGGGRERCGLKRREGAEPAGPGRLRHEVRSPCSRPGFQVSFPVSLTS